jgi:hypothetical protein
MESFGSNSIHNLETKEFQNESGRFPAIVMGLNILDIENAGEFIDQVVESFKVQRTCSPVDTMNMTVTIVGDMTADEFRSQWLRRSAVDPVLEYYMSSMVMADVLHLRSGKLADRASLIP